MQIQVLLMKLSEQPFQWCIQIIVPNFPQQFLVYRKSLCIKTQHGPQDKWK